MIWGIVAFVCAVATGVAIRSFAHTRSHIQEGHAISAAYVALSTERTSGLDPRVAAYGRLTHEERLVLQADIEDWFERCDEVNRRAKAWQRRAN